MAVVAPPSRRRQLNPTSDPWSPWLHVDIMLVLATAALAVIGLLMVYSTTRGTDPSAFDTTYLERQGMFLLVGAALMAGAAVYSYQEIRPWIPALFGFGVLLLVAVLSPLGVERNGSQAWFELGGFQFQPSEPLKLGYILALATYLGRLGGDLGLRQLMTALAIGAIPLILIMQQPDVGTALVFVAITMGMLLVGGARVKHIFFLGTLGIGSIVYIWNSGRLASYQVERLTSFIDPSSSQSEAAYQQTQAQIAIGSGGVGGQGYGKGIQTRGEFVPEQHTDFIFTVVGEELGFVGASVVLCLFAVVIWRCWRTAKKAADLYGSMICVGVMTMLTFQMFQSVGMTLGIMPITGIPVPLVSYGGSSAITSFLSLGIVLNVHMRRHQFVR